MGGGSLGRGSVVSWPLPPLTWEEAAGWAGGFPACYRRFCMVGKDHPIPTPPIPTTTPTRNPSSWGRPPPPPPPKTIQSNLTPFPQCTQRTLQVGRAPRGHPIQPLIQLCPLVAIKADETSEITHPRFTPSWSCSGWRGPPPRPAVSPRPLCAHSPAASLSLEEPSKSNPPHPHPTAAQPSVHLCPRLGSVRLERPLRSPSPSARPHIPPLPPFCRYFDALLQLKEQLRKEGAEFLSWTDIQDSVNATNASVQDETDRELCHARSPREGAGSPAALRAPWGTRPRGAEPHSLPSPQGCWRCSGSTRRCATRTRRGRWRRCCCPRPLCLTWLCPTPGATTASSAVRGRPKHRCGVGGRGVGVGGCGVGDRGVGVGGLWRWGPWGGGWGAIGWVHEGQRSATWCWAGGCARLGWGLPSWAGRRPPTPQASGDDGAELWWEEIERGVRAANEETAAVRRSECRGALLGGGRREGDDVCLHPEPPSLCSVPPRFPSLHPSSLRLPSPHPTLPL